jgi:hypothetical protein
MLALCWWILFARAFDYFWQVAPGFPDMARNLHWTFGMAGYVVIPAFLLSVWFAYYFTQLKSRPVFVRNDPHVPEILEAEHVHA